MCVRRAATPTSRTSLSATTGPIWALSRTARATEPSVSTDARAKLPTLGLRARLDTGSARTDATDASAAGWTTSLGTSWTVNDSACSARIRWTASTRVSAESCWTRARSAASAPARAGRASTSCADSGRSFHSSGSILDGGCSLVVVVAVVEIVVSNTCHAVLVGSAKSVGSTPKGSVSGVLPRSLRAAAISELTRVNAAPSGAPRGSAYGIIATYASLAVITPNVAEIGESSESLSRSG